MATLGPGEHFGEVSLLQGVRHTASVRALTPVDLLSMNGTDFSVLAASSTRFGELLAEVMRQRLSSSDISDLSRARLDGNDSLEVPTPRRGGKHIGLSLQSPPLPADGKPVHLRPRRRPAPPGEPRHHHHGDNRSADRQLPGGGRHSPVPGPLQPAGQRLTAIS